MIFASNNQGKLREIREIFSDYEVLSLNDAHISVDVLEDQNSFYGNALKKAKEIYEISGNAVIADDSGLILDALGDWPGVLTHRFLGEEAGDDERNQALIEKADEIQNRHATVSCVLVYFDGENIVVGNGDIHGNIAHTMRGENGFGFDSIFELEDGRTLAELSSEEKNKCSARYLASLDLKQKLEKITNI